EPGGPSGRCAKIPGSFAIRCGAGHSAPERPEPYGANMSTTPSAPSTVVTQDAALWCRRGSPPRMESMHRHNDIEINVVLRGRLQYVFAGRPLAVREGQIAAFWAAQPHGLIDSRPGDVAWVHVPLPTVLGWRLPDREIGALAR